jgi:hypothetical protein
MKKIIKQLTILYYAFYVLAIVLATIAYVVVDKNTAFVEPNTNEMVITTVYILFLVCSIPLALKLFNIKVRKLSENESIDEKIEKYRMYSFWRLMVIGINMLIGIGFFYFLSSDSMLFCAGIAAIALVFCKPSERKMEVELDLDSNE